MKKTIYVGRDDPKCTIIVDNDGIVYPLERDGVVNKYHISDRWKQGSNVINVTTNDGVRVYHWIHNQWSGPFPNCDTWEDIYHEIFEEVGLPLDKDSLITEISKQEPILAERINKSEEIMASISETPTYVVNINKGNSGNRILHESYWRTEIKGIICGGGIEDIPYELDLREGDDWRTVKPENVVVIKPKGAKIIRLAQHVDKSHGIYITISMALSTTQESE